MVRWAPLAIPIERRLQTAAMVVAVLCFPICMFLLALLCLWQALTRYYTLELVLLYCLWWISLDRQTPVRGGRISLTFRRLFLWRWVARYFPASLHAPAGGYDPRVPHIFGVHPHGIISMGVIVNLAYDANRASERIGVDYRILTVSFNFLVPLWREVIMWLGFVSASPESAAHLLRHGQSVMVVVGGAREALSARPGCADLTLARRKGFVRLALQFGARLVPCYNFGENEMYEQAANPPGSLLRRLQDALIRVLGFTVPLFRGRGIFQYDFGVLPRRVPVHTVMGPAIEVPRVAHPSPEDVDHWHGVYVAALHKLYADNADKYYHPTDFQGRPIAPGPLRIIN